MSLPVQKNKHVILIYYFRDILCKTGVKFVVYDKVNEPVIDISAYCIVNVFVAAAEISE